jgi:hypothetical protein
MYVVTGISYDGLERNNICNEFDLSDDTYVFSSDEESEKTLFNLCNLDNMNDTIKGITFNKVMELCENNLDNLIGCYEYDDYLNFWRASKNFVKFIKYVKLEEKSEAYNIIKSEGEDYDIGILKNSGKRVCLYWNSYHCADNKGYFWDGRHAYTNFLSIIMGINLQDECDEIWVVAPDDKRYGISMKEYTKFKILFS